MATSPSSFRHRTAFVNGINLHFVDEGAGDKTVVLCHGWPDLWFGWRNQIRPIAAAGFRVIVPDLRGFGQSDAPEGVASYTWKNLSADLIALLDHLGIGKAVFLGHDWGGEVVWKTALYHPTRVVAVGAVCTPFVPRHKVFVPLEDIISVLPAFKYQAFLISPEAPKHLNGNVDRFFKTIFRSSDPEDHIAGAMKLPESITTGETPAKSKLLTQEELDYYIEQYTKRGFDGGLNLYKTRKLNWDLEESLPRTISHKALMITAGKDAILSPKMSESMNHTVPNLTRGHVENAGHWILSERAEEVNKLILNWLKSVTADSKL